MELDREEEESLRGEHGETLETAYRILVATGEALGAEKLVPIEWAHLSGVNYNTIGDAGERFLAELSRDARVVVRTSVNPMGYDIDSVSEYDLGPGFVTKQESIRKSYIRMGASPTFSCIPYDILAMPKVGTQVALAESNAAIYANSITKLRTNKESAFSALASALTGKSPYTPLRRDEEPRLTVRATLPSPDELDCGLLGYFAGRQGDSSVNISGIPPKIDHRSCKSLCGGMGTSGTCAKFLVKQDDDTQGTEEVEFGEQERRRVLDELDTGEGGDIIVLGSPQLALDEIRDLAGMLKNRSFTKDCMVFCPRTVSEQAKRLGYENIIRRARGHIFSDCCACLTPLIDPDKIDSVITNSVKGAYYLNHSTKVNVNLKPLAKIIREHTR